MDVKKLVLLVGALMIAGISAFFVRSMLAGAPTQSAVGAPAPTPVAEVTGNQILVATKTLSVGTIIDAEALKFQPWPKDLVDEKAYFLKDTTDLTKLTGKVVRFPITAGQPVTQGALIGPGERGFLAAALGPGMRAVTVSVSPTSGVAGFVFPGDRVDLVVTQDAKYEEEAQAGEESAKKSIDFKTAETVLQKVRVLAIDQQLSDPQGPKVGATVTLEVTPKQAEMIAVAQKIGSLTLTLRSIADNAAELEAAIATGKVDVKADQTAADDRAMERKVAALSADSGSPALTSFTTGDEVSRFQPAPGTGGRNTVRVARGSKVTVVSLGAR